MSNRILIVEDEPTLLFALQEYLTERGYSVDTASEPDSAYAMLMRTLYDVIVTDIRLTPVRRAEGLDLIEFVRERSLASRVIVLTGTSTKVTEGEARRLGIDRFIRKPVPLAVVADAVSQLLAAEATCGNA